MKFYFAQLSPCKSLFPYIEKEENKDDFSEVAKLHQELIKYKSIVDEERFQRKKYEDKLHVLEERLSNINSTAIPAFNDSRTHPHEDYHNMKEEMKHMREEMEEMKTTITEKTEQLEEYRVKYLQAQQEAEEMKRQLDIIEYDNKQVSEQIQIEIQKMKMQFQEKLQELAPLPDLLKASQMQLQEAKQYQKLAEDSSHQLSSELHRVKEKLVVAVNSLNQEKAENIKLIDEIKFLKNTTNEKQNQIDELNKNIDEYRCKTLRLEEKLTQEECRYKERAAECSQLLKDMEDLRVESSRSIMRCKERSDSTRRYQQAQISELEKQLVQTRAQCKAVQKERDEIRQRIQMQLSNLQENFEIVEIRLRALQNQVVSLKSSYGVILGEDDGVLLNKITI